MTIHQVLSPILEAGDTARGARAAMGGGRSTEPHITSRLVVMGDAKRKTIQGKGDGLQEGLMEEVALSRDLDGAREQVRRNPRAAFLDPGCAPESPVKC